MSLLGFSFQNETLILNDLLYLYNALSRTGSKITIATQIIRKLLSYEEKGLLMQYHSINTQKLQKRMKNRFSNIAYQIRWSVRDDFKIIISTKFNAVESNHSDESDIRRI